MRKSSGGWWIAENAVAPAELSSQDAERVPAGFTREFHVLTEVCESMSSGFMLLNHRAKVTYSNSSALRLLRVQPDNLEALRSFDVRKHLLSLVADPQQVRDELDKVWTHPDHEYSTDLSLADAAVQWLRVRSFPVRDHSGNLLGRGMLIDDITLEHSLAETRAETLAAAAHELKTPLAIIKGCATTLLGSSAHWDPAMQREMLQMIDTHSDRLHDILNTLLDVWRLDAGTQSLRMTQVQLPELLQQLIRRWQKHASGQYFVLDVPPHIPPLVCDAVRIEQVLHHLLNNAAMYSSAGKTITIRVESNDVELRVSIADEGIGIAPEHLDRIFDRFYHVHQRQEHTGSGLGLASSRATIEAHGGTIWADSAGLGQGATFYFTLPLAPRLPTTALLSTLSPVDEPVAITQPKPARKAALRQDRRVRVLLAEKDTRLVRYLRANLEEQQYRVQTVNHGVQFLRQLDLEEPDVIILSTSLTDMSGIELLQRLREFSNIPVIMLCDDCAEDERVQLFDLGSDDLVIKPFGMKELLARVRALLRRQAPPSEHTMNQALFVNGDLVIDYAQHLVTVQNRSVQLSRTEYKLLNVLAQNVGMVMTHELLLEKVWGPEYNRDVDFIWVYISRLRRKIETDPRHPRYVLTIPDVGYKLAKL